MSFKAFLLWVVIILCGLFIYLKASSLGDENSYFNRTTRYKLGRYTFMRNVLGLRKDGDARADYLFNRNVLTIEVARARNVEIPAGALEDFAAKVGKVLGREVRVISVDTFQEGVLNEKDVEDIVNKYRRHSSFAESNVFVVYAQDFQGGDEEIGRTYRDFGILLSSDRISQFTSYFPESRKQYISSTLLHEFGHQVGLSHINNPNCIMDQEVGGPKSSQVFSGAFTVTDFCNEEVEQLKAIKASLQ